jgi:type I restriction enzyme M protein
MSFQEYLNKFDSQFSDLETIDSSWYEKELGIKAFCSKASSRDSKSVFSEEYIRARFVFAMVNSGMYQKEYICVEFGFPKGNGGKSLNPDIVVFKNKEWLKDWEDAKQSKNFAKLRQNLLAIFETKKDNKSVSQAVENQLRSAMAENESEERVFGVYFDDQDGIIILKKSGNSEVKRFFEDKILRQDGISDSLNLSHRDSYIDLPSQKDFIQNNESISDLTKLTLNSLDAIDETTFVNLMNGLKRANDRIKPKHSEKELIVEFLTLKVYDEKRSKLENRNLEFYILPDEKRKDGLTEISFRERIKQLYKDAQREYAKVLSKPLFGYTVDNKPLDSGDERFLVEVIENFQKRAILKAKNENFNQIIFNNFGEEKDKADKGQFFTPIPVVNNIIRMLSPEKGEELCDPCCGICDFPAMAFRYAHRKDPEYPSVASHYYGFDLIQSNLKLAELNLVLNGDGGATLENMDSLSQKLLANGKVSKSGEFSIENFDPVTWKNKYSDDPENNIKKFKIIATNPPFGKGRDLKTGADGRWDLPKQVVEMYETYKEKSKKEDGSDGNLPNSMDMGVLFLENAYKCLEDGGRMAIVLSNSIASIKEWQSVRKWFIERMRIVALWDLPANTFGETGVSTTVIVAYKPKPNEKHLLQNDYEVFIKEIENIGYEVKTKNRTVHFDPQFIINEETFEKEDKLLEDFSTMQAEFNEYLKRQEEEIKKAFHFENIKV